MYVHIVPIFDSSDSLLSERYFRYYYLIITYDMNEGCLVTVQGSG